MSGTYIPKNKLAGAVTQLLGRYRVFGPVRQGRYHEFAEIRNVEDVDLAYRNTRLSPKGLFHPQGERMFRFSMAAGDPDKGILKEAPKDFAPRVILGIRPCDAKAFRLDDANFDTATIKDPWWVNRRETTTLIGLACNHPCGTCFCTSVGTGPFDASGLDAMLVDTGGGYVVEILTEKGKAAVEAVSEWETAPNGSGEAVAGLKKSAEESVGKQFDIQAITGREMLELFNGAFWEEVQFACINCGTCTFLCPTCWCFDIQDEVCGEQGDRLRMWDSCMFPLFTFHGSGHNPRNQKVQRVRQRFMHKLKYYPDKYHQGPACVGCGRCVSACPVNIDIRQVARLMSAGCVCPA